MLFYVDIIILIGKEMIPAEDNCVQKFEELRLEKNTRYIIYKI